MYKLLYLNNDTKEQIIVPEIEGKYYRDNIGENSELVYARSADGESDFEVVCSYDEVHSNGILYDSYRELANRIREVIGR